MQQEEPNASPAILPRVRVRVVPLLVAAAWGVVGVSLLMHRPETEGWNVFQLEPFVASPALSAIESAVLLLIGALCLLSRSRLGWWGALTLSVLGAALHPYQLVLSFVFVPYLLTRDVREEFGLLEVGGGGSRVSAALGGLAGGVLGLLVIFHRLVLPNFMGATELGKQKRTMGDLRTIATAVESYSIDHGHYPRYVGNVEGIAHFVEPTYIRVLPTRDGWRTPFWYVSTSASPGDYRIQAFGHGGVESGPLSGQTTNWTDDIIFQTGSFLTYPDGTQR